MWSWIQSNADAITAVVAVLGLLVASWLGYLAIRVAARAHRAEQVARSDTALVEVLDRVNFFLEAASLPYWKETPPAADDELALTHHEASSDVESAVMAYSELQLVTVRPELIHVAIACRAYYQAAVNWSEQFKRNPDTDLWSLLSQFISGQGVEGDQVASTMRQLAASVTDTYGTTDVDVLQLTSSYVELKRGDLIAAYSKRARGRDPLQGFVAPD
jgi:hypothetical protein